METKDFETGMGALLSNHLSTKVKQLTINPVFLLNLNEVDGFNPDLVDFILNYPVDAEEIIKNLLEDLVKPAIQNITVRFVDLPKTAQFEIANIRAKSIDKLIQVTGLIKKVSNVFPFVTSIDFECPDCGHIINLPQGDNKRQPKICPSCGKSSRQYKTIHEYTADKQKIVLTSAPGDEHSRMEMIEVIAERDLCDPSLEKRFLPGNRVIVSGILKSRTSMDSRGISSDKDIFLLASYITVENKDFYSIEISEESKKKILEVAKDPNIYNKFIDSFAPFLYDLRTQKEAILYQLFGGVTETFLDKKVRGDIHILLIGDPGVGKSTLGKFAVKLAPKSLYISAKTSSGPGLVGAVTNDGKNNWTLDVGALGLMNKGFLNIDELDQFNKDDFKVFNEALEHGEVTIEKAARGKWPTEEPILAEANPKNERFDRFDIIANQITFPRTTLSRFDLIFILKDTPGDKDREIFKRMALKGLPDKKELLSIDFMREYIAYAKQNCVPVLSDEAEAILENFYIDVRTKYEKEDQSNNTIPVSARVGEAMRRIAQASARWRLSDVATAEDAARAINITLEYLKEVGLDPSTGRLDLDRMMIGVTGDKRKAEVVLETIKGCKKGNRSSKAEVYEKLSKVGIDRPEVDRLVELINQKEVTISEQFDSFVLV